MFCVLRKRFYDAVWIDSELKSQSFQAGLSGRKREAAKPGARLPENSCEVLCVQGHEAHETLGRLSAG